MADNQALRKSPFDSELHALIAGALTAALDLSRLDGIISGGRVVRLHIEADDEGTFLPEWTITVGAPGRDPTHVFKLRLEQEKP